MSGFSAESSMVGAESTVVTSGQLDHDLKVSVAVLAPPGSTEELRSVYVMDANLNFEAVVQIAGVLRVRNELPPMCVVGIGYPTGPVFSDPEAFQTWFRNRLTDLSPVVWDDIEPERKAEGLTYPGGGGAKSLLECLVDEVIPAAEDQFGASPRNRTIVGHSGGAIFTLFALLSRPDIFARCVAVSPGIWPSLFDDLADDWGGPDSARLFLARGELEDDRVELVQHISEQMNSIGSNQLHVTYKVFPEETHVSVWPGAYSRGLRDIFAEDSWA